MINPKIICISGKAGSGKDTAAGFLKDYFNEDKQKSLVIHYADLLKYICHTYLGWNQEKDEYGRNLLQFVGTDIVRKDNPNFWIEFVFNVINYISIVTQYDYIIIADCRFPNEIEFWKAHGYEVYWLYILRDFNSVLTDEQKKHSSETSLDEYELYNHPIYVNNNDSLTELKEKIRDIMVKHIYQFNS